MGDLEPPAAAELQTLVVAVGELRVSGDVVEVGIEPALGDDLGVELLERAASRIAGIGEERQTLGSACCIDAVELCEGQQDLPAHLEFVRPACAL